MTHILQTKYWKEVKRRLGNEIYEVGPLFFHTTKLPIIGKKVAYMPRPDLRDVDWKAVMQKLGESESVFMTIDAANLITENIKLPSNLKIKKGHPIHLQRNTIIDITLSEDELLKRMHQKTRYNLRLSEKKGVKVTVDNSAQSYEIFKKLYVETMSRQDYVNRSIGYIDTVIKTFQEFEKAENTTLLKFATASFQGEALVSWLLFTYDKTIYFIYGGSSEKHRNVMPNYSLVWEIINWGKQNGYQNFDLWGLHDDENDGFTRFKLGFGAGVIEYADTIDVVVEPVWYNVMKGLQWMRDRFVFVKKFV